MKLHSDFWLGERIDKLSQIDKLSAGELASYKRSISNFVRILTQKPIPVMFELKDGASYTDGNYVTISSAISEKYFDSIVGLALHEASHIVKTDFNVLKYFNNSVEKILNDGGYDKSSASDYEFGKLKELLNYVEDRRIDRYVIKNAPGYREYYEALYDRYFNDKVIDKAIASEEYRDVTWDSYMFRIINFTNKNRDLNALPYLSSIYKLIFNDLPNLTSTEDSLKKAISIYDYIERVISEDMQKTQQSKLNQMGLGSGNGAVSNGQDDDNNTITDDISSTLEEKEQGSTFGPPLTQRQRGMMSKLREKQRKFLDGDIRKTSISKKMSEEIESITKAESTSKEVEYEGISWSGSVIKKQKTIVLRGLNENTIQLMGYYIGDNFRSNETEEYINEGFVLGKSLGKRLQIRNYEKITEFNRQKRGKIDKRRIYSIGANDFDIFKRLNIEKHTDAFLHISVDLSSSMSGRKYRNAIKSAVAIAQMSSMTNIDVQLSLRVGDSYGGDDYPIMWVVYDSRKNKISNLKKYLKYIYPKGITPEGLCFDAVMDELPISSSSLKTYFINFSDGAPYYYDYSGKGARKHTKNQVDKLKIAGYNILSFFVTDGYHDSIDDFKEMYGESATSIDPTDLPQLAKRLQKMFEDK